ncbi:MULTISPECIES: phytanoyl-CoA dioxygenase family protein [unclassified Gordonia (in: high G+C Gram-positive bacteria)]|uniref:phytanoyl-CoA dioxygenase family protein n=1 Tax=unclassified Gordonia (in: high G+C Gram-positive bacteria) TaxID=2657482 RepID=UPI001F0DDD81|nr:phytanoyl-CoA dioxygenase family protein [Gordonia sp. ABSL49_1]MCH5642318.1 phytanoyl-CoA dioxygenase family protein [Gordonia sp. ABSL49_1]
MSTQQITPARADRITAEECRIDDFIALTDRTTDLADYPFAASTERGVLFYDAAAVTGTDDRTRAQISDELARALLAGPGIVVFAGAFGDAHALRETTGVFSEIIADQHAAGMAGGDHFAKPGANDRIWNALQKFAQRAPELYSRYYANDVLALISEAWLGPMYQVTSQVNVVNPGGAAQNPHRDYHLGFMSTDTAARFRAHIHRLSPALTLQGAVAHVDMPIESGPTMYLPYSQTYEPGYLAFNLPDFREHFARNYVQLPLSAGDAVFFNPALFHGAGHNVSSDIRRMANLLQISSAFGRAMDAVDRSAMLRALYPALRKLSATGDHRAVANVIASAAEGYAFPTNLDIDAPITGLAGETQAELVARCLAGDVTAERFDAELTALDTRHDPNGAH